MAPLRATRSHALLILAGMFLAIVPSGNVAAAFEVVPQADGIVSLRDGSLHLSPSARPAPAVIGSWERYGIWDSPRSSSSHSFDAVRVRYQAEAPTGTASFVAVRASADGQRWSEWISNVPNGEVVRFRSAQRWTQHRVILAGSATRSPSLARIDVTPEALLAKRDAAKAQTNKVAPTYRLRVTRQGMIGGRTANGHRIKAQDMFVSLPSWSVLSSREGNEYMVRLSANGKSVVVPVMDVGPWNRHDNFWSTERERYKDLPVGWPQDHAAYYEGHNKRRAEKGWVRYPSAVDVGDGAYWALGLKGAQATLDITFLWLGEDPGASPEPLNSSPAKRPVVPVP